VALAVWRRGRSKRREWKESIVAKKKLETWKKFERVESCEERRQCKTSGRGSGDLYI
jgi:hypothetical protein